MCALFAATHPERAAGLVMIGSYARSIWAPDHPWGLSTSEYTQRVDALRQEWGGPIGIEKR